MGGIVVTDKEIMKFLKIARKDLAEKRYDAAVRTLSKVEELEPGNLEVQYLLGIALVRQGKLGDAEPHLLQVVNSEYTYMHTQQAYMLLGYSYSTRHLYGEAEIAFNKALDFDLNNEMAFSALGHVYYKMGHFDRAKEVLQNALEIDPDNNNARNSLAYVLCESGDDLDTALKESLKSNKNEPSSYAYMDTLGWIYYKKGKELLARETLKRALELSSDDKIIKNHLREVLDIPSSNH